MEKMVHTGVALSDTPPNYRLKASLLATVICVALGTNSGCYNTAVVNNLGVSISAYINNTAPMSWLKNFAPGPAQIWSLTISSFAVGTALGTVGAPLVAECLGRRLGLITSSLINTIGGLMCAFYLFRFELVLIGRLSMGLAMGLGTPIASTFVTEISPINHRGQLNSLLQIAYGFGDLLGMLLSTSLIFGTLKLSPYALSFTVVFSSLEFCVLCLAHESPRFLILNRKKFVEGEKSLKYYQDENSVAETFKEIISEDSKENEKLEKVSSGNFCTYLTKKPLLLACLLLTANAFSGIGTILSYSTDAFLSNGVPSYAEMGSVTLGLANLIGSFLAMSQMETRGRKSLLICGITGCFCCISGFTVISLILKWTDTVGQWWAYSLVPCLVFFMLCFSMCGASTNTLAAEICPQTYRSLAVSLANFCLMLISAVLIYSYDLLKNFAGPPWVFFPSAVVSMAIGFYLFRAIPETKNKSLTEIKKYFENGA